MIVGNGKHLKMRMDMGIFGSKDITPELTG